MGPRTITRTTKQTAMDESQVILSAVLVVVLVLLVVLVVLRAVFPPIPPLTVEPEQREHIQRANHDQK